MRQRAPDKDKPVHREETKRSLNFDKIPIQEIHSLLLSRLFPTFHPSLFSFKILLLLLCYKVLFLRMNILRSRGDKFLSQSARCTEIFGENWSLQGISKIRDV